MSSLAHLNPHTTPGEGALHPMEHIPLRPRLAIKVKGRILLVRLYDVVSVQAQGNYVILQRQSVSHVLRESMSAMAKKLMPYGFVRIHRSVLVNGAFVQEIDPDSTGTYRLRLKGGQEFPVTRAYKPNLRFLAECWAGRGASLFDRGARKAESSLGDRPRRSRPTKRGHPRP